MSAAASWRTVVMPCVASLASVFAPMPQIASGGRSPSTSNQVVRGQPADARRLAEARRDLGLQLVVADADRAVQAGGRLDVGDEAAGEALRVIGGDADERLVPAEDLDRAAGFPQHVHHYRGDLVIRVGVHRQEHAVRAALGGGAQRLAGVHAELPRLVGGGGDHAALGRVAVPADHDRLAAQLGMALPARRRRGTGPCPGAAPRRSWQQSYPAAASGRAMRLMPVSVKAAMQRDVLRPGEDADADGQPQRPGWTRPPFPDAMQTSDFHNTRSSRNECGGMLPGDDQLTGLVAARRDRPTCRCRSRPGRTGC